MEILECSFVFRQIRSKAELRKRRAAEVDDENTYRFKFTNSHTDLKNFDFQAKQVQARTDRMWQAEAGGGGGGRQRWQQP